MHVLFAEGLADDGFLAEHVEGEDELRSRAGEWPLQRASAATGLREEEIAGFARLLAEGPTFLKVGPGSQRHADAGTGVRAAILLPAVTGAWRHPGGGALVHSASAFAHPDAKMAKPELRGDRPQREVNMVLLGKALAGTLDEHPPLSALVVHSSNPAVVVPDSRSVRGGLARDDLFTVVLEQFMTETASYADVVLPATTQLEHLDVLWSWGHYYLTLNLPAIAPRGQSRPNTEIFRMLAATMGEDDVVFRDKAFADDDEALLATYLASYPDDVVEQLRDQGFAKVSKGRRTGSTIKVGGTRLLVPDGRDLVPDDGRFTLLTPKSHHFLNSTFVNHARLAHMAGVPRVRMAASDAARLGIADGTSVRLRNEHGDVVVDAEPGDDVLPGTLVLFSNWWGRAGPNSLTGQDVLADLAGAPIFSPRVELVVD